MYTRKEWQKFLETMEEIGVTDEREIAKLKKDYFGFEEEEQSTIKKLRGRKKQDKSNIIVKKEQPHIQESKVETERLCTITNQELRNQLFYQKQVKQEDISSIKEQSQISNKYNHFKIEEQSLSVFQQQQIFEEGFKYPPRRMTKVGNNFFGSYGHSTLILFDQIIDGTHYFQCQVRDVREDYNPFVPSPPHEPLPCFRIGVTIPYQHLHRPLGGIGSYCFKSESGDCLHERAMLQKCQIQDFRIVYGDTVGLLFHLDTPYRRHFVENQKNINPGSYLVLFANGKQVNRIQNLKQDPYVFGVSLFNESFIAVNTGPDFKYPPSSELIKSSKRFKKKLIPS